MMTQIILAIILVVMAIVILSGKGDWRIAGDHSDKTTGLIFTGIVIVLTTVAVILANTWAKKK
jgi:hypothetical protein